MSKTKKMEQGARELSKNIVMVFLALAVVQDQAIAKGGNQCVAPESYISQYQSSFLNKANQDFSCLVDYTSISPRIQQYQLVDIRQSPEISVFNAWAIPFDELKHKSFLKTRPLLLLGDGFSRVDAARQCAALKKKGFQNTKILVGGVELWSHLKIRKNKTHYANRINAKELLIEYFSGSVHLITPSSQITQRLEEMGFPKTSVSKTDNHVTVSDIVINKAAGGMDAVVYITEDGKREPESPAPIYNLYVLEGGIESLAYELTKQQAMEQARLRDQELPFCAQ